VLKLIGEPEYRFTLDLHDPEIRRNRLDRQGIDRAVIAISSPIGIEWLPGDEALELLGAYNRGVRDLGPGFASWGALSVLNPDRHEVDRLLLEGHIGISLPAESISTESGFDQLGPVLSRLESNSAPLFVHPGPVYASDRFGRASDPGWWAAMTGYINQMNRAWHAFVAIGRERHPDLRVVFAMLAGGAPLHNERLVSRSGPAVGSDPGFFYDTSSYGTRMIDATVRVAGIDQIVFGSDDPVVSRAPQTDLGTSAQEAITVSNPSRLLGAADRKALAA